MSAAGRVAGGATVVICGRKDASALAAALTATGPGVCAAIVADVTDEASRTTLLDHIRSTHRVLHVLVNNSGTNWAEPLESYSLRAWRKVMDLNVDAVFALTRAAVPLLKAGATPADPSRVINIGSIEGVSTPPHDTFAYSVSKAAVLQLSRVLAFALTDTAHPITVNTLLPGPFPSKMMRETIRAAGEATIAEATTLGRIGQPGDMAGAVIYLASAAGKWVTGAEIVIDGGCIIRPQISMASRL
jgi:NAD(P)-dependent dehydrogenase (short-subunit alcohol dehydrogenase family)